eukprot:1186106-Prorocentrum_minimum.AAC.4
MIRRPPRSTQGVSSAASDVYKRQPAQKPPRVFWGGTSGGPCLPASAPHFWSPHFWSQGNDGPVRVVGPIVDTLRAQLLPWGGAGDRAHAAAPGHPEPLDWRALEGHYYPDQGVHHQQERLPHPLQAPPGALACAIRRTPIQFNTL